jgi:hypothetical protein
MLIDFDKASMCNRIEISDKKGCQVQNFARFAYSRAPNFYRLSESERKHFKINR